MTDVAWNLRDARGRLWHDGDKGRLEAWVREQNRIFGLTDDFRLAKPFRSETAGYGYPVPEDFKP